MTKILLASLLILAAPVGIILNNQPTNAETFSLGESGETYDAEKRCFKNKKGKKKCCVPKINEFVEKDAAYHPNAYKDGYREGEQSLKEKKPYKPRTAGGEFGRGFEDGYYGRKFTGQRQEVTVPLKFSYSAYISCDGDDLFD